MDASVRREDYERLAGSGQEESARNGVESGGRNSDDGKEAANRRRPDHAKSYGDFELKFDWRVSEGGNTGLKYRIQKEVFVNNSKKQEGPGAFEGLLGRELSNPKSDRKTIAPDSTGFVYTVAFEFQLIDDERHPTRLKDPLARRARCIR